jgi:hypothetical protein
VGPDAAGRQLGAHRVPHTTSRRARPLSLLNKAEKRLLAEWMDLGGQYFNDPFDSAGRVRRIEGLSEATFLARVQPVLQAQCASCHQAGLGNPRNRFVLTGSEEGDFNVTLSLVSNTCVPESNALLARPSTVPHPSGQLTQTTALLPPGSPAYEAIAGWVRGGCSTSAPASARTMGPASR